MEKPRLPGVSDSQFHMWRTLFALIHVDNVIANEEIRYAAEALVDVDFTEEQRRILQTDLTTPQNPAQMFAGITDLRDQARFFKFAKELVWVDRNYAREEKEIVLLLEAAHINELDLDEVAGYLDFAFEDASTQVDDGEHVQKMVGLFKETLFKS